MWHPYTAPAQVRVWPPKHCTCSDKGVASLHCTCSGKGVASQHCTCSGKGVASLHCTCSGKGVASLHCTCSCKGVASLHCTCSGKGVASLHCTCSGKGVASLHCTWEYPALHLTITMYRPLPAIMPHLPHLGRDRGYVGLSHTIGTPAWVGHGGGRSNNNYLVSKSILPWLQRTVQSPKLGGGNLIHVPPSSLRSRQVGGPWGGAYH